MSFWDLFLLFSLYMIGFYHLVVGVVGVVTGVILGKAGKTYPSRESGGWGDIRF
jgi:hypothetical protein